jgi:sugar diacid utilization regulator
MDFGTQRIGDLVNSRDDLNALKERKKEKKRKEKKVPVGNQTPDVQLVHEKLSLYRAQNVLAVARNTRRGQKC